MGVEKTDAEKLVNTTLRDFRMVFSSIQKHFKNVEAQCGISGSQLWVLWELRNRPGLKVSELATKLSIHQSTASNLIDKLARRSMLQKQRQDVDQRVVRLFITEQGLQVLEKAPGAPRGILLDALEQLNAQDLQLLHSSLAKVVDILKPDEDDALMPLAGTK